ncbi:hypothetical protein J6590_007711 [Homalodisca vitripennis]|nr:hypothetical protein J6590_007711 [Homalodisca vitripennis]
MINTNILMIDPQVDVKRPSDLPLLSQDRCHQGRGILRRKLLPDPTTNAANLFPLTLPYLLPLLFNCSHSNTVVLTYNVANFVSYPLETHKGTGGLIVDPYLGSDIKLSKTLFQKEHHEEPDGSHQTKVSTRDTTP